MFLDRVPPHEASIIWIEAGPETFAYVREIIIDLPTRKRPPSRKIPLRIVAHATLTDAAKSTYGRFSRRVWHVAAYDPYDGRGHPIEAVDPTSISAGVPSRPSTR